MPRTRTRFPSELLVEVRRDDPHPLHRQLEQELRSAIRGGRLQPEMALPSTRVLAEQLDMSRGVVVEAYEQLVAEGYLTSVPGGATRVATRATVGAPDRRATDQSPEIRINFAYGRPDVTQFPRQLWLRSMKRVLSWANTCRISSALSGATETKLWVSWRMRSGIISSNCLATPATSIRFLAAASRAASGACARVVGGAASDRRITMAMAAGRWDMPRSFR